MTNHPFALEPASWALVGIALLGLLAVLIAGTWRRKH